MSNKELIKCVWDRKIIILAVFLTTVLTVGIYYGAVPYEYKSSIKIYVEDEDLYSNEIHIVKSSTQKRLFYYVKSTEMFDYLIEQFDLYQYYNIDSTSNNLHYGHMTEILQSRIHAAWEGKNILTISVSDVDKYMAAKIANQINIKLDEMNQLFIASVAEKQLRIYEQIIERNKSGITAQIAQYSELIEACKELIVKNRLTNRQNDFVYDFKLRLMEVTHQVTGMNNDLVKASTDYQASAAAMRKENMTNLKVINVALPDTSKPFNVYIIQIALIAFAASLVTILLLMIYFEYGTHFDFIFGS